MYAPLHTKGLIEYIPLQQGLRPLINDLLMNLLLIEYIPLQQGLRPCCSLTYELLQTLIEYIPLQQGLRLFSALLKKLCRSH